MPSLLSGLVRAPLAQLTLLGYLEHNWGTSWLIDRTLFLMFISELVKCIIKRPLVTALMTSLTAGP